MSGRWWCNQKEMLWRQEPWGAFFLSDDGSLWGLDLRQFSTLDFDSGQNPSKVRSPVHWDLHTQSFVGALPSDFGLERTRDLEQALKRAAPTMRARMTPLQATILDQVAARVRDGRPWITARKLRHLLASSGDREAVTGAARALCPRYVERRDASDGEYFEPTFAGLLESSMNSPVSALVEATLLWLREAYSSDPDINMFRWSPIRDTLGSDDDAGVTFARNVYLAMGWQPRGQRDGKEWLFDVPTDIEEIQRCSNLSEYIAYLRRQPFRPWPTCPEAPVPVRELLPEIRDTFQTSDEERFSSGDFALDPMPSPGRVLQESSDMPKNSRDVFVVHGRNKKARDAIFDLLRSVGLNPMEWEEARRHTGHASPYVGDVLDAAFVSAQAIVVLLTGDDEARLRKELQGRSEPPHEIELTPQPRPNVLFEAGLALGRNPTRTVLVEIGSLRPISDVVGRHVVRICDGGPGERQTIVDRLKDAGCTVTTDGRRDWLERDFFSGVLAG